MIIVYFLLPSFYDKSKVKAQLENQIFQKYNFKVKLDNNWKIYWKNPGEAGFTGSLIIAEFSSLDTAKLWADSDPYITAGVYQKVTVKPYKKVLPT